MSAAGGGDFIGDFFFPPEQVLRALRWRAVNSPERGEFGLNAFRSCWCITGSARAGSALPGSALDFFFFWLGQGTLPTTAFVPAQRKRFPWSCSFTAGAEKSLYRTSLNLQMMPCISFLSQIKEWDQV